MFSNSLGLEPVFQQADLPELGSPQRCDVCLWIVEQEIQVIASEQSAVARARAEQGVTDIVEHCRSACWKTGSRPREFENMETAYREEDRDV